MDIFWGGERCSRAGRKCSWAGRNAPSRGEKTLSAQSEKRLPAQSEKKLPAQSEKKLPAQSLKNFVFEVALLPHKELIKQPIKCKHLIGCLINSSLALLISYIVCTKMGVISTISGDYLFLLIFWNLNSK